MLSDHLLDMEVTVSALLAPACCTDYSLYCSMSSTATLASPVRAKERRNNHARQHCNWKLPTQQRPADDCP